MAAFVTSVVPRADRPPVAWINWDWDWPKTRLVLGEHASLEGPMLELQEAFCRSKAVHALVGADLTLQGEPCVIPQFRPEVQVTKPKKRKGNLQERLLAQAAQEIDRREGSVEQPPWPSPAAELGQELWPQISQDGSQFEIALLAASALRLAWAVGIAQPSPKPAWRAFLEEKLREALVEVAAADGPVSLDASVFGFREPKSAVAVLQYLASLDKLILALWANSSRSAMHPARLSEVAAECLLQDPAVAQNVADRAQSARKLREAFRISSLELNDGRRSNWALRFLKARHLEAACHAASAPWRRRLQWQLEARDALARWQAFAVPTRAALQEPSSEPSSEPSRAQRGE
ncbi:unnamed protein product [Effrenium voratum]|nr:unnamed protein product [Effrenium voratum]